MKDYYKILEVHFEASDEVIGKAYRTLAQRYHPDRYHHSNKQPPEEKMKALNEAYEVLNNPGRRQRYDQSYQQWLAEAPLHEKESQKQKQRQQFQKIGYSFVLTIFLVVLFKAGLQALLMLPAIIKGLIVGSVVYMAFKITRK